MEGTKEEATQSLQAGGREIPVDGETAALTFTRRDVYATLPGFRGIRGYSATLGPRRCCSHGQAGGATGASGRPFYAHFVDVASSAGLHAPVIYGGVESKKYILEATGCGCAFIDYDNDGWMDIFLLSGTRLTEILRARPTAFTRTTATAHLPT